jgi:peptidoglycan/LPS O-acetylase OafA/YrhL
MFASQPLPRSEALLEPTFSGARARFDELDALRGLAAATVVFEHATHFVGIQWIDRPFGSHPAVFVLMHSPLMFVLASHQAVILFFVLSGFVLSLPWIRGESIGWARFAIKRVCRLWLPYICAIVLALSLRAALITTRPPQGIASNGWVEPVTPSILANYVALIGHLRPGVDFPVWSMVHEMRLSLIFPLIMLVVRKRSWKIVLMGGFLLSLTGWVFRIVTKPDSASNIWDSLHYTGFFLLGYLVAANLTLLQTIWRSGLLTFVAGISLYTYHGWFFPFIKVLHPLHLEDWLTGAGSALLIVASQSFGGFGRFLRHTAALWLGRVSYSLYLLHVPVLVALFWTFDRVIQPPGIAILGIFVTLLVSEASYRWIEVPAIRLARSFSLRPSIEST